MDFIGYCVRVDALDGYADKLPLMKAYQDFESIVGVKHKGVTKENPHFHFVIKTNVKDQAFRVRLRKIFDQGKGNAHMSIKTWDGKQEAIAYLFHEDPEAVLVLRHNVSDDTIAQAQQINRLVQQMVTENKVKASWRAEDIVYQELMEEKRKRPGAKWTDAGIAASLILTCLRTGKYSPQPWLIRAMTERIQFRLLAGVEEEEEALANRLARRIFYTEL